MNACLQLGSVLNAAYQKVPSVGKMESLFDIMF